MRNYINKINKFISTMANVILFLAICSLFCACCNCTSYVIHYEKVILKDFNPKMVDIHQVSYKKYNDTTLKFSAEFTPLIDFGNNVMVAFKMYKLQNDEFIEYPMAFTSSTCDIWKGLYNVKDMANYGNITACDVVKDKMMYVKDYVPNFNLPVNLITGTFKTTADFTFNGEHLSSFETRITIDSPLDN